MIQFLMAALVLFTANAMVNGAPIRPSGNLVTISSGRVDQIAESFRMLAGRPPSRHELQALVKDYADEEIFYREAVSMGLDVDDTIVRRRMRQKLEFLSEEGDMPEPTDAQLKAWLSAHRADYRLPQRITFRQVLASGDIRGAEAKADAASYVAKLNAGADVHGLGDESMLPSSMPPASQQDVASQFGEKFASALFRHRGKGWFGPVLSPLGAHAVLITATEAARDPSLQEVKDKLRSDWIEAQRRNRREQFVESLRKRYKIEIQWPKQYAG